MYRHSVTSLPVVNLKKWALWRHFRGWNFSIFSWHYFGISKIQECLLFRDVSSRFIKTLAFQHFALSLPVEWYFPPRPIGRPWPSGKVFSPTIHRYFLFSPSAFRPAKKYRPHNSNIWNTSELQNTLSLFLHSWMQRLDMGICIAMTLHSCDIDVSMVGNRANDNKNKKKWRMKKVYETKLRNRIIQRRDKMLAQCSFHSLCAFFPGLFVHPLLNHFYSSSWTIFVARALDQAQHTRTLFRSGRHWTMAHGTRSKRAKSGYRGLLDH